MTGAISWAIRWTDQACPVMEVVFSRVGDTGTSSCLTPWDGATQPWEGSTGSAGYDHPDRPRDDVLRPPRPSGSVPGVIGGGTIAPVDGWSHTGQCIFTIPVGHTVYGAADRPTREPDPRPACAT